MQPSGAGTAPASAERKRGREESGGDEAERHEPMTITTTRWSETNPSGCV